MKRTHETNKTSFLTVNFQIWHGSSRSSHDGSRRIILTSTLTNNTLFRWSTFRTPIGRILQNITAIILFTITIVCVRKQYYSIVLPNRILEYDFFCIDCEYKKKAKFKCFIDCMFGICFGIFILQQSICISLLLNEDAIWKEISTCFLLFLT